MIALSAGPLAVGSLFAGTDSPRPLPVPLLVLAAGTGRALLRIIDGG